jgi:hypothetical protein
MAIASSPPKAFPYIQNRNSMMMPLSLLVFLLFTATTSSTPDINVNNSFTFCAQEEFNCGSLATIPFTVTPNCTDDEQITAVSLVLDINNNGQSLIQLPAEVLQNETLSYVASFNVPAGSHALQISVENACGDQSQQSIIIEAGIDCTPPAPPLCLDEQTVVLDILDENNDGYPDDWDYEAKGILTAGELLEATVQDFDFCHPGTLNYSVNRLGASPDQSNLELLFTCEDIPCNNPTYVEVNAWDESGNRASCTTKVVLEVASGYSFPLCDSFGPGVAGTIETEQGAYLEGVLYEVTNNEGQSDTLESLGNYFLCAPPDVYTLRPIYDGPYGQGVSIFDYVLLSQHLLGVQLLDSPYKMIAADVNGSNTMTTLDLITIRKLLLGIIDEFPNEVPSWRFIRSSYVFPTPQDPWQEDGYDIITIDTTTPSPGLASIDFVAVKMGDLNLDAL